MTDVSVSSPAASAVATTGGARMLVVDDNRDAADTLCMYLRAKGHDVRVAYDGVEGMGAAIAFKPQVVLLDIGLPKMYGYEVAREIREKFGASVLIIAVTGYGQEEDRRLSKEAGFDHHFTKPVDLLELDRLFTRLGL
jgi:DNA-binding response OmpR family regulator